MLNWVIPLYVDDDTYAEWKVGRGVLPEGLLLLRLDVQQESRIVPGALPGGLRLLMLDSELRENETRMREQETLPRGVRVEWL